jgi:hypothetical protein
MPIIYKAVFRADYKPSLGFYDKLFPIVSALSGYEDWITTGLSVTLQNFDARCSFTLAHNLFVYVRDMKPQRAEFDEDRIQAIIESVPKGLGIKQFQRLGYRCWSLCQVKMKFEELVFVVNDKFLLQSKEIKEAICPLPTDVAYVVHFDHGNLRVKLRIGPMKREETEAQFQPDRNTNFAVKERALPAEELFEDIPETSLLMDFDVSQNEGRVSELPKFFGEAKALQSQLSENVVKYVFGVPSKGK